MKKLLTLILGLVILALPVTNVMNQTQTTILNTSYDRWSQRSLVTNLQKSGCTSPPSGMVAWWPLDGLDSNGEYEDMAGGDNNGRPIGNPSQIPNQYVGNSLQAGTSKAVTVPDAQNLYFGFQSFTIDAWVKYTPGTQTEPIVYKLANLNGSGGGFFLYLSATTFGGSADRLDLQIGSQRFPGPQFSVPKGTWIFVAATVDKTKPNQGSVSLYVYVPGKPPASSTSPASAFNASSLGTPLVIGAWSGNPHASLGIDEVEIFNRALTQPEIQSIVNAGSAGKCSISQKKGMTWFHTLSNAQYGTITVGCGPTGPDRCDPAHGDTLCTQQLPVLCIYKPPGGFRMPVGLPPGDQYNRWSGGVVATTQPHAGNFQNTAEVNSYCRDQLGPDWRVAEFHDGVYWNFQAYGGTVSAPTVPSTRFWVYINDQKDGNCWQP